MSTKIELEEQIFKMLPKEWVVGTSRRGRLPKVIAQETAKKLAIFFHSLTHNKPVEQHPLTPDFSCHGKAGESRPKPTPDSPLEDKILSDCIKKAQSINEIAPLLVKELLDIQADKPTTDRQR